MLPSFQQRKLLRHTRRLAGERQTAIAEPFHFETPRERELAFWRGEQPEAWPPRLIDCIGALPEVPEDQLLDPKYYFIVALPLPGLPEESPFTVMETDRADLAYSHCRVLRAENRSFELLLENGISSVVIYDHTNLPT
jgi:hypothetical protein